MSFQGEGVGNERRGVELSLGQECEDFRNIAAIHPACLEGEVFPYISGSGRIWGVSYIATMVTRAWAGRTARPGKGIFPASGFYDHISAPVLRMG